MYIIVHLATNGASKALLSFLRTAVEFQEMTGATIATDITDEDFLEIYGFTKADLASGIESFKYSLKKFDE